MPKNVPLRPNGRIDIPDLNAKTTDYTQAADKQLLELLISDNRVNVVEGFRVQIADQGTFPGLFTVVNGFAVNRDGQVVNNEDDVNATRSATLLADSTYYVEVEYLETDSDVAPRAHWDSTYDNGDDPSGDPRPDGHEFATNVATRTTPDWQIVSPISTSGFAIESDPDSNRIPVAVLTLSAGVLSTGDASPLKTVLAVSQNSGANSLQFFDTRAMPDAFTLTLHPGGANEEDVTVTSNDRENGILTFSAPTVEDHTMGENAVVGGVAPADFLDEKTTPALPGSGTQDARPRLFQADEDRGFALGVSPTDPDFAVKSDAQITNLQRHVDFIAAELRALKFGSASTDLVGNKGQATEFAEAPRYFDYATSVMGAKTNTVSVGDGINSWGDFNSTQSGTARDAIVAAIAAVPTGGIVYIKKGTYTMSTAITVAKDVRFIGDGAWLDETELRATGSNSVFSFASGAGRITLEDISVTNSGSATYSIVWASGNAILDASRCVIEGISAKDRCSFSNCIINANTSGIRAVNLDTVSDVRFEHCFIHNQNSGSPYRCVYANDSERITFVNCHFTGAGASADLLFLTATSNVTFVECVFDEDLGTPNGITVDTPPSPLKITLIDCVENLSGTFSNNAVLLAGITNGGVVSTDTVYAGSVTAAAVSGTTSVTTAEKGIRHAAVWKHIPLHFFHGGVGGDYSIPDFALNGIVSAIATGGAYYIGGTNGANRLAVVVPVEEGQTLTCFRVICYDNSGDGDLLTARCWNQAIGPAGTPPGTLTQLGSTLTSANSANMQHLTSTTFSKTPTTAEVILIHVEMDENVDVRLYALMYQVERTS